MNSNGDVQSPMGLKRGLFIVAGTICLGLGALGIILPLLPTTPFLLLSAACYLRGSNRMYQWLLNNKWFGTYIRNYREGKGIPLRGKIAALVLLWITISLTAIFIISIAVIQLILFTIATSVSIYLIRLPTLEKSSF
jgi:uncharacterized membrane protein YbaN (DUF454 family)